MPARAGARRLFEGDAGFAAQHQRHARRIVGLDLDLDQAGVLFQHGALISSLTVLENITVPLREVANLPEDVANDIFEAQQKGKDVLYTKSIWRVIMMIIKMIPEWKFKGMSL